jgi:serine/threonine protein kinase
MRERAPGDIVNTKLRLVQPLATGGMGSVWIAHHMSLDTPVAVKFITSEFASQPALRERFAREARAAARIAHANVISIKDFGETPDGALFIEMELCRGESLRDLLRRTRCVPPNVCTRIVTQMASALEAAHAIQIAHRDIKPENDFLQEQTDGFHVKVLDFGIAKLLDDAARGASLTGQGSIWTLAYMSPEQVFTPGDVDARADVWSTAVVAYESLCGVLPFPIEPVGTFFVQLQAGRFDEQPVPPELLEFFRKAFAVRLADRFQTPGELARALDQSLRRMTFADDDTANSRVQSPSHAANAPAPLPLTPSNMSPAPPMLYGHSPQSIPTRLPGEPAPLRAAPIAVGTVSRATRGAVIAAFCVIGALAITLLVVKLWPHPPPRSDDDDRGTRKKVPASTAPTATARGGASAVSRSTALPTSAPSSPLPVSSSQEVVFDSPADWSITTDEDMGDGRLVIIEGPHNGFVSLLMMPESSPLTLDEYANNLRKKRSEGAVEHGKSIASTSTVPTTARIAGVEVSGMEDRFAIKAGSLSVDFLCDFFDVVIGRERVFVNLQVPAEDLESVRPGAMRIYDSLRPATNTQTMDCSTPKKTLESQLAALKRGAKSESLKQCFTERLQTRLTQDFIDEKINVAELKHTDIDDLYVREEDLTGSDEAKKYYSNKPTVRIYSTKGSLTTMVKDGGRWRADSFWFGFH